MAQSVSYHYWSDSNKVRIEVIQVDNGASHVNVSANFQVNSFDGAQGYQADADAFNNYAYYGDLTAGQTYISFNGTNGAYTGSGWKSIATKWVGTIPRSAGTFKVSWATLWEDTYETQHALGFETPAITIMAYTPPNAKDTLSNYSAATIGTAVTFTVTNSTSYAHTDTLSYSIGNASGNISSSFSVAANSTKTITWTPPSSLGAQIPTSFTGTVTLTLTTSGQGSDTYTCQLTVPSYTYTMNNMSVAKTNYTTIGGTNYVAGKHTARWTMPTFPSAKYGATLTGTFYAISGGNVLYTKTVSSGGTADYSYGTAGTVTGSLRVEDSRGVTVQKTTGTTWVANPSVSVTFTAKRSGATTTVNLVASGTYSSTLTGLAATLEISKSGTPVQSAVGAGGTASISTTDTLALASSQAYIATMTDTLGNVASKTVTVPTSFQYIQVGGGANGKGVAIGRAASTTGTDSLEIGLPTIIDEPTRVARFREYMQSDVDNNVMASVIDILTPRVSSIHFGADSYGTSDDDLAQVLRAYLIWLAKNFQFDFCQTHGILNHRGMYSIEVCLCRANVDANGVPRLCMGTAYGYGVNAPIYRFGTNEHSFFCYPLGVTGQFMVQKAFLTVDTNNISHSADSIVMAPHVGYADLGLSSTNTMAEGFYALIQWLKTNYASNSNIQKSRCIVHGTFAGRSNGVTERNIMYWVMFYDISQSESNGTAPRYCTGWAMALDSLKIFTFRNVNGNFKVYEHVGTEVTA